MIDMTERCKSFWGSLAPKYGGIIYELLMNLHAIPTREYHNIAHVEHCLQVLDNIPEDVLEKTEDGKCIDDTVLECAIWFHDAIYKPSYKSNEDESAVIAASVMNLAGLEFPLIHATANCIRATKHLGLPRQHYTPAEMFMMDIDISGFGEDIGAVFFNNMNIGKEFSFVPQNVYVQERNKFLQSLLNRKRIYYTDYFFTRLEENARKNLVELMQED